MKKAFEHNEEDTIVTMKPPLRLPDTPKSCWSETISDLNDGGQKTVNENMRRLLSMIRLLESRLSDYGENKTSGFKLLMDLDFAKSSIIELSEALKAAHVGIKEVPVVDHLK